MAEQQEDSAAYPLEPPPVRTPKPSYLPQYMPPGWTTQHYDAMFENRKARSLKRGSSPTDAHQEAADHLREALKRGLQPPPLYTHSHLHGHAPGSELEGTIHKHPHSHVAGQPHPDPRHHHHTHTGSAGKGGSKEKLTESFNWLMPFKTAFEGAKHLIKGAAITVGKTKNRIAYTVDELLRAARTLTQKPLLINHLETIEEVQHYLAEKDEQIPPLVKAALQQMVARGKTDVGEVVDSEFEDNEVEYVAQVTDPATQQVVDAGLVKGVSIGAIPRTTGNPPKGILFTDLSLITDPEIPGDPDATAEIMEKLREMLQPTGPNPLEILIATRDRVNREILRRVEKRLKESSWNGHESSS